MRRVTICVILLTLLAGPTAAEDKRAVTAEEILKKKDSEAVDKQYDTTMKRLKQDSATPVRADPWANMRAPAANDGKR